MKNIARHIGKTVLSAAFCAIPLIANCQSSKDFKYLNEPAAYEGKAAASFKVFQVFDDCALAREKSDRSSDLFLGKIVMLKGDMFYDDQIVEIKSPMMVGTYKYESLLGSKTVPVVKQSAEKTVQTESPVHEKEETAEKKDSAKQELTYFGGKAYPKADTQPSFPGGPKAMMDYISKNTRYPKECQSAGIQGRVIVKFDVDEEGRIHNIEVVRSVHGMLDAEAVRLIKGMPAWIPAKQNGKNVNSKFMLPVFFKLVS